MKKADEIPYWSLTPDAALTQYRSTSSGLTGVEAAERLSSYGENTIHSDHSTSPFLLFLSQFKSPIILIMLVATAISAATGDLIDSLIIFAIVLGSAGLSFSQEYSASNAVAMLRMHIQMQCTVLRDGTSAQVPSSKIVPGDIVKLSAGSIIPADGIVLDDEDFLVNQSALTGESMAVEKRSGVSAVDSELAKRSNCVYMGTTVQSGSATMLITLTGARTEFGGISSQITARQPETEFERGIRRFGYFLTAMMLILTVFVFVINVVFHKPVIDSLLFSVALAVGITPQLLPAIINITLSRGSRIMAKAGVIVRRLTAIENFGSMDTLCTDKTGTLTEGVIRLDSAAGLDGNPSDAVFRAAYLNAKLQTGLVNTLDEAILTSGTTDLSPVVKRGEIPYDFYRKRLSVIVEENGACRMITKGALKQMLSVCTKTRAGDADQPLDAAALDTIQQRFSDWSGQGFRVLGVAEKAIEGKDPKAYTVDDEAELSFIGFLLFFDPPKADAKQTIETLARLGVQLRIITGDNALVAKHTACSVGLCVDQILTGAELMKMDDAEALRAIETAMLYAEMDPSQKERIILALKKSGHVVGYMGDGINDAPALRTADVSISVNTAVDIAKDAANFVLLEKSLDVLNRGIELGRAAFSNTLKYIYITTSANFGNMFSMAGASLFMPFLPLLPKQILLINFMTDFPAMTVASDAVDSEAVAAPRRWDIKRLGNFMLVFGFISSAFDYITFGVLLLWLKAGETLFQSGWFILSIVTELMLLLVMRTQKPFFMSKPAPALLFSTIGVAVLTLILPYIPLANVLGISPIPPLVLLALLGIAVLYIITTEIAKHFFFKPKKANRLPAGS
ncbi:MAG TPA: magnesium-translocating P-type ATPase [Clostridia bacterium]|nr:magnesium-translocating P-type ATPase [Clostridia bacterium]